MLHYRTSNHVLINTNFSGINPVFTKSPDVEVKLFRSVWGWDENYTQRLFAEVNAVFPRYLDTVGELVSANPHRRFVLRPHPFENQSVYRERFAASPNLIVDGSGDILKGVAPVV